MSNPDPKAPPAPRRQRFEVTREQAKFQVVDREGKLPLLTGYCMVWGALSSDRGGYKVRLAANSAVPIDGDPVFALCHHDYRQVLSNSGNGTLKWTSDNYGLQVEIDPADTSYARDMIALVRRGDVKGMSFSMLYDDFDEWAESKEAGEEIVTYSKFHFDEITITPIPAFVETTIESEFSATPKPQRKPMAVVTPARNKLSIELQKWQLQELGA